MTRAGSVVMMTGMRRGIVSLLIIVAAAGCSPRAEVGSFDSPDPQAKLYAIIRAGNEKNRAAIPHLIDALGSDDQAVRMYAIESLRRITGHTKGYVYYAAPKKRDEAIARWLEAYRAGEFAPGPGKSAAHTAAEGSGGAAPK